MIERSENVVSHHVRVLRPAGLVCSHREDKLVIYALINRRRELFE